MNFFRYPRLSPLRIVPFAVLFFLAVSLRAEEPATDIEGLRRGIQALEAAIVEHSGNDDRLVRLRQDVSDLSRQLIEFGLSFRPRLAEIAARAAELGPQPKEGDPPEAPEVQARRAALAAEKSAINGMLGDAESLSIRLTGLADRIGDLRRELFARALFRRTEARGSFSAETASAFSSQIETAWRAVRSRAAFAWNFKTGSTLAAAAISAALALGAILLALRFLAPARAGAETGRTYLGRLSFAFWSTVVPSLGVGAALLLLAAVLSYFGLFVGQSREILHAALASIAALFFIQRLSFAIFAPGQPHLRLIGVTNSAARWLVGLTSTMAAVQILDRFLGRLDDISLAPLSLTVAKSLVSSLAISLLLLAIAIVKPFPSGETGKAEPWPAWIRLPLVAIAAIVIAAALSGYVGLARFLSAQIVITGAILATMFIGIRSGRAIAKEGGFLQTTGGKAAARLLGLTETGAEMAGVLASLAIYALVLFAGLPLIALQWGFQWPDISRILYGALTDIRIGTVSISPLAILLGFGVFAIGILATRRFQSWLDGDVMRRSRVDVGVRNSIRTVAGYAGIGLAGLIGLSMAGFNLSNLAIIAGALSLGIGFGLQNVVSNFVSGLILLVERPFRVGDWIEAGKTAGFVRKIAVRATEIETFQGQSVTLPNSELVNGAVTNWTLRNNVGRIDIPIGVSYDADPEQVEALLLGVARAEPEVVRRPEPVVYFKAFGESSLEFELRAHVANILNFIPVSNRLRKGVLKALSAAGIRIPYPQRDVRLGVPEVKALSGALKNVREKPRGLRRK
jgi:small-conductance mechanosensitive channel